MTGSRLIDPSSLLRGHWLRQRRRNVGFAVAWGAIAAMAVGLAIAAYGYAAENDDIGRALPVVVFLGGLGVLVARVALGCARAGVRIDEHELVIRGPWTTRHIPISQVARFRAGSHQELRGRNATPGVLVDLRTGTTISVWALGRDGFAWNSTKAASQWDQVARRLNELVVGPGP